MKLPRRFGRQNQFEGQIAAAHTVETRLCSHCREELPVGAFRPRRKGSDKRHTVCRLCFNAYIRERRQRKRPAKIHGFTSQLKELSRVQDIDSISALVAEMPTQFGGIQALGKAWGAAIEDAKARKRNCLVVRSFFAIADMHLATHKLKQAEEK